MNRRETRAIAYLGIAAAALLMVCSMNSWLYPINPWVDVNIISTVGRGMFDGKVPYRDLVEQKGPLLFLIFGLGMKLTPGTYHGLYLLETVCVAAAMAFGWRTLKLYAPKAGPAWIALGWAVLIGSDAFRMGGSAEEFLALPLAWSLYDLLRCWRGAGKMDGRLLARNGFLAGCVLWSKFNLLSFHFVWMAAAALDVLARERDLGRAVKMCLWFLLGMALASAPWLIYFGVHGALGDLAQCYFLDNLFGYRSGGGSPLRSIAMGLWTLARRAPGLTALLALAGASVLLCPRRWMAVREKATVAAMAVGLTATLYVRISGNLYYAVIFGVFLPFAFLPLAAVRAERPAWLRRTACAAALALGVGFAGLTSDYARFMGTDYETLPQAQIAQRVGEDETLLSYLSMDAGFYMAAGVEPAERWFTALNVRQEECVAEQTALAEQGGPDWLVSMLPRWMDLELDRYELAGVYETDYAVVGDDGDAAWYLFKRTE